MYTHTEHKEEAQRNARPNMYVRTERVCSRGLSRPETTERGSLCVCVSSVIPFTQPRCGYWIWLCSQCKDDDGDDADDVTAGECKRKEPGKPTTRLEPFPPTFLHFPLQWIAEQGEFSALSATISHSQRTNVCRSRAKHLALISEAKEKNLVETAG